jgi:eukaryotic-like serine/threonine-protein kinase
MWEIAACGNLSEHRPAVAAMKTCPTCNMRYPDEAVRCLLHAVALVPFADPRLGTWVAGRYLVEAVMGEGGMATVYRARQRLSDRYVALKIVGAATTSDAVMAERFRREAKNASKLAHPNIIEIFEHGTLADDSAYIAMELLQGEPMDALIARGPVPLAVALPMMVQCARGIARAHDFDVIHRDVKPENIFLCHREDGTTLIKLLDFGIARSLADSRLTSKGDLFGTPQYMAPERISGKDATGPADLYALGVVFFELLTGRLPFDANDVASFFVKHISEPAPPPSKYLHDIPAALDTLILSMLAKDARLRPVDAHELLHTLLQISFTAEVALPPNVGDEPLSSAVPTTVGEENLGAWPKRIQQFEALLVTAFGALSAAPQSFREQLAECTHMAADLLAAQETRLERERGHALAETKHREGRQRYGYAMDALGTDASGVRADLRLAVQTLADLAALREADRLTHLAQVRKLMVIEGRSGMTTPTAELAAAYHAAGHSADAWCAHDQAWRAQHQEVARCEARVSDLDFQLEALRAAASRYEEEAEAEYAEHAHTAAALDQQTDVLKAALDAVARHFLAPLRLRAELAELIDYQDQLWAAATSEKVLAGCN